MIDLDHLLDDIVSVAIPAAVVYIRTRGNVVYQRPFGHLDPKTKKHPTQMDTLFDLASLTKLWTVTAFLRLVAAGQVGLDTPVADVLPEFVGKRLFLPYEDPLNPGQTVTVSTEDGFADAGQVTFYHLLTHSSGLPAWRPIFQQQREWIRPFVQSTFFSYPIGTNVVYSDLGLILLGWVVAKLAKRPLASAIQHLVTQPLNQSTIQFGPTVAENVAPTEFCQWRQRRMRGEVHDENAWKMGGVAGHAGLFGTASDVAQLGQTWLDVLQGKSDFLPHRLAQTAVSLQTESGVVRRGLGWALWSPLPASPSHPLSHATFGHTGFTGTSLYIDPEREMVIVCLTNEVFNGRKERKIGAFRVALHEKVVTVQVS
ncbi:Beta-lactamase class C-like and penicillin binding proteins (PBPs) superfamily [hydrothermal vent metagenome]|uniref:Beta-lactamase class C-like and penicillin binding proteins (PBPs) superfamily n=1 Tax=hydrothermal vent metagenome TaxID=652676 RepID=A0A3B0VB97_9ZZZZ